MKFSTAAILSGLFYLAAAAPAASPEPANDPKNPYQLGECVGTLDGCIFVTTGLWGFPSVHYQSCDPNAKCTKFRNACTWLQGNAYANCT